MLCDFFHRQKLIVSALLNIFWIIFVFTVLHIQYQTIDDYWASVFCGGGFGVYDPYMININIIYGFMLTFLSKTFISVPWYSILLISTIYCSMTAICYVIYSRYKSLPMVILLILMIGSMILPDNFQFTVISCMSFTGGILLWLNAANSEKPNPQIYTAIALILNGSALRQQCIYTSALFVAALLAADLFNRKRKITGLNISSLKFSLIIAAAFAASIFMWFVNDACYQDTPERKAFYEMKVRTTATDYHKVPREEAADICSHANLSKNDYGMLLSYNYDDAFFSKEKLEQIVMAKKECLLKKADHGQYLLQTLTGIKNSLGNILTISFLGIILAIRQRNTSSYIIACLLTTMMIVSGLNFMGRALDRVIIPQFIASILIMLAVYGLLKSGKEKPQLTKKITAILLMAAFIACGFIYQGMIKRSAAYDTGKYRQYRSLADYMKNRKNNFYIYDTYSFRNEAYGIFETPEFAQFENSTTSGDWWSGTAQNIAIKEKYGIKNIFTDLTGKNNVFYIVADHSGDRRPGNDSLERTEKISQICIFLKEHYNINAQATVADVFGKNPQTGEKIYYVYKFSKFYPETPK